MSAQNLENLHPEACGLKLHKHNSKDELLSCELVIFSGGRAAVNTVLRRAALAGTVKVEPFDDKMDYFADVYTGTHTWEQSVLLDKDSYRSLKNHWMRCSLVKE
jgi:hypothetical protein